MNPTAIKQLQANLGLPQTGIFDSTTMNSMNAAISAAASANPNVQKYSGGSSVDSILNAYTSGDWSGVLDLTGKPFTDDQQKAAVAASQKTLAPAYDASKAYDTATTTDALGDAASALATTERNNGRQFGLDKNTLDKSAADSGTLFAGSRFEKENDLRTQYQNADAAARAAAGNTTDRNLRSYASDYGTPEASKLATMYRTPGATTYDASVAGGKVTPSKTLAAAYDPGYAYQGTKPVAQKAAVQTRAAGLLANRANKLSLSGYGTKF